MNNILLDLNYPEFQKELFNLQKIEQTAFLNSCKKIRQLTWESLYKDKGMRWEEITSKKTKSGNKIFSIRFSQKYKAVVTRDNNFMGVLTILCKFHYHLNSALKFN